MKICPVCETQNQDGAKNCEICGEPLSIPQSAGAAAATPAAATPAAATPAAATPSASTPAAATPAAATPAAATPAAAAPKAAATSLPTVPAASLPTAAAVAPAPPKGPRFCPIEGLEFAAGTPEHGDGYCACGAELVNERAQIQPDAKPLPPEERGLPPSAEPAAPAAPAVAAAPVAPVVAAPPPKPAGPALPPPGTWALAVYLNKQPVHYHAIENDETLIGRYDLASGADPELDLTPWDETAATSRKHAFVYRQDGQYSLKPVTNSGTQLGKELVPMGERKPLKDGDVLILGGKLALKFLQVK